MKQLKLIATDFDGTLHTDTEYPPIPVVLQQMLARFQAAGVKWVINTGRDMAGVMEAMARAHLTVKPDYLALVEREIYAHDGGRYVGLEEWNNACARDQAEVFARVRRDLPELYQWVHCRYQATVYEDPWSPFCVIAENNGDADQIVAYLEDYCRKIPALAVVRNDVYARFSHAGYNKGTVLSEIARQLQAGPERILAAGDHFNDLPMLDHARARWLIAPANAIPAVKAAVQRQGGYVSSLPWGHGIAEGLQAQKHLS
jgi:HAD superfamily hydrolase (TIGR01484 family)